MPMSTPEARPARGAAWRSLVPVLSVVLLVNIVAWTLLLLVVAPAHLKVGTQVFGIGIGLTAYTLGMRHAFDADHIAAIDNTTRKLLAEGRRPVTLGFWFALGHSTVVVVLVALGAAGARAATTLARGDSAVRQALGVAGTSASGLFLYAIGILNLVALVGIVRVYRHARRGTYDAHALEAALDDRGFITRLLRPLMRSISQPIQMYPIGLLFGIGFDTATEVAVLVVAATGAAGGLPWYAILVLPLLFTAGMSLFDTLDGAFMTVAYRWAFATPIRKIYYNLTITALSVAVALLVGTIELVGVLHARLGLHDRVTDWVAGARPAERRLRHRRAVRRGLGRRRRLLEAVRRGAALGRRGGTGACRGRVTTPLLGAGPARSASSGHHLGAQASRRYRSAASSVVRTRFTGMPSAAAVAVWVCASWPPSP